MFARHNGLLLPWCIFIAFSVINVHALSPLTKIDSVVCKLSLMMVANEPDSYDDYFTCQPVDASDNMKPLGGEEYDVAFTEDNARMKDDLRKSFMLQRGDVYVSFFSLTWSNSQIILDAKSTYQVMATLSNSETSLIAQNGYAQYSLQSSNSIEPNGYAQFAAQSNNIQPTHTVLILRVVCLDSSPDLSATELYDLTFTGRGSLADQIHKCSGEQFTIEPEPTHNGVLELPLAMNANGTVPADLVNEAKRASIEYFGGGVENIREVANHIMIVLPPGTSGGLVATAEFRGQISTYNNMWGGRLSATMHELSHNLGLLHAYYDDIEYNDKTGYMGRSDFDLRGPEKCFNPANFATLGWFEDYTQVIDPANDFATVAKITAFVDYDKMEPNALVLVRVGDIFLGYNRAKRFNEGSPAYRDSLTIVRDAPEGTHLLTGLDMTNPAISVQEQGVQLQIEVCDVIQDDASTTDSVVVSVGKYSRCAEYKEAAQTQMTSPTASPTVSPTVSSTMSPTPSPTMPPTRSPTPPPTDPPVRARPRRLTLRPTVAPSPAPTKTPSLPPTNSPTKNPTSSPTTSPFQNPTPSPTMSPSSVPTTAPSSIMPSSRPSDQPSPVPSDQPSPVPSLSPPPTLAPTTPEPSNLPTSSQAPSAVPSAGPTNRPTISQAPSQVPSSSPTNNPTTSHAPSVVPSNVSSLQPTQIRSKSPTVQPTMSPKPSPIASDNPTTEPTPQPSALPSPYPTMSTAPSQHFSGTPTAPPSASAPPSSLSNPSAPNVVNLVMIDGNTKEELFPLVDNMVINAATVDTSNLIIRANIDESAEVGSLEFDVVMIEDESGDYDADKQQTHIDNQEPYQFKAARQDFTFSQGKYSVVATPYFVNNAKLKAGRSRSITFLITDRHSS